MIIMSSLSFMLTVVLSNLRIDVGPNDLYKFPSLKLYSAAVPPCINIVSASNCNNKVPNSVYTWCREDRRKAEKRDFYY